MCEFSGYSVQPTPSFKKITQYYTPKTARDALTCCDSAEWKRSIADEFNKLIERKTCQWVPVQEPKFPHEKILIGSRLVFKCKLDSNNDRSHTGWKQQFDPKYSKESVYSATLLETSLLTTLAISAEKKYHLFSFDFQSAYLHAALPEKYQVYLKPPSCYYELTDEGRAIPTHLRKTTLLKCVRSIYGLRISGRLFFDAVSEALTKLRWRQNAYS